MGFWSFEAIDSVDFGVRVQDLRFWRSDSVQFSRFCRVLHLWEFEGFGLYLEGGGLSKYS